MKNLSTVIAIFLGFLFCNQASSDPAQQRVAFNFPGQQMWSLADTNFDGTKFIAIYLPPPGRNSHSFLTTAIIPYVNSPGISALNYYQKQAKNMQSSCAHVNSKILGQTRNSVTFKISAESCEGKNLNMVIFGKIFNGADAVYLARYDAEQGSVTSHELQAFSKMINSSYLIPNSQYQGKL